MKPSDSEMGNAKLVIAQATLEDFKLIIGEIEQRILRTPTPAVDDTFMKRVHTTIATIAAFAPEIWTYPSLSPNPLELRSQLCTIREKVKRFISEKTQPPAIGKAPEAIDSKVLPKIRRLERSSKSDSRLNWHGIWFSIVALGVSSIVSLFSLGERHPPIEYKAQIESLDRTKSAIESVVTFIDNQKKQLQLSQTTVEELQKQQTDLNTVVSLTSKQVDALLAVQERRNQAAQSHQMWIGLWLGVLSSVGAAGIVGLVVFAFKNYLGPRFAKE